MDGGEWLAGLRRNFPPSGDLAADVDALFATHGREKTREHVPRMAHAVMMLARWFGVDSGAAQTSALLHNIGGIVAWADIVALSESLNLPIVTEERRVPMLLHAKLGVVLAHELYGVTDTGILQAIRFHTTLHAQPTPLDMVVFLADELEWDQGGIPPYCAQLMSAMDGGLEAGARWFLGWMASPQARLLIPHPDLRAAWTAFGVTPPD